MPFEGKNFHAFVCCIYRGYLGIIREFEERDSGKRKEKKGNKGKRKGFGNPLGLVGRGGFHVGGMLV